MCGTFVRELTGVVTFALGRAVRFQCGESRALVSICEGLPKTLPKESILGIIGALRHGLARRNVEDHSQSQDISYTAHVGLGGNRVMFETR